jgi:hypothetical protein
MMKMKFLITPLMLAVLCLFGVSSTLQAEEKPVYGYVYAAPGERSNYGPVDFNLTAGGGGEALLYEGFGAGADIGYVFLNDKEGFGIFSPGIFYQFQRENKLNPFVEGGYALGFRSETFNMAYVGGGFNYWPKDRVGFRFEVRDNIGTADPSNFNLLEFRLGLLFR